VHEFIIYDVAECQLTDFNSFTRDVEVLAGHLLKIWLWLMSPGPRSGPKCTWTWIPFLKIPIVITTNDSLPFVVWLHAKRLSCNMCDTGVNKNRYIVRMRQTTNYYSPDSGSNKSQPQDDRPLCHRFATRLIQVKWLIPGEGAFPTC